MNSKTKSLISIFFIYLIVIILAYVLFQNLSFLDIVLRLLLTNIYMTLVIWILSLILKNASLYDPYWSVIPPILLLFVLANDLSNISFSIFVLLFSILFWSIRLTHNWAINWQDFSHIDWRYDKIRNKAPKLYFLTNLLAIQLFPTMIVFIQLIGPINLLESTIEINLIMILGSIIMITSAIIQYISDKQMRDFKLRTKGTKEIIEEGLWKYSRHPNYFGEIMFWWGLYIMYVGGIKSIDYLIIAPILMTSLFIFVSIPWMEKKIISTRKEYLGYQKRVSMLIPFIRKENQNDIEVNI